MMKKPFWNFLKLSSEWVAAPIEGMGIPRGYVVFSRKSASEALRELWEKVSSLTEPLCVALCRMCEEKNFSLINFRGLYQLSSDPQWQLLLLGLGGGFDEVRKEVGTLLGSFDLGSSCERYLAAAFLVGRFVGAADSRRPINLKVELVPEESGFSTYLKSDPVNIWPATLLAAALLFEDRVALVRSLREEAEEAAKELPFKVVTYESGFGPELKVTYPKLISHLAKLAAKAA